MGVLPARLLPPRPRALTPVPPDVPGEADRGAQDRRLTFFGNAQVFSFKAEIVVENVRARR